VPDLDAERLDLTPVTWEGWQPPLLLVETADANGAPVRLCDFASAGQTGTLYRSWLPVRHAPDRPPFTRENPLRSRRV
jgi:hypothetical protein